MPDIIITYENLYEILRREKYRTELQKVDDTFFRDVVKYLQEKTAILSSQSQKDSIFASTELVKTQNQIRNIQKILKELYEKRENKIIQSALFSSRAQNPQDTSAMLPQELAFYRNLKDNLDKYRQGILYQILQNQLPNLEIPVIEAEQKDLKTEDKTNTINVFILEDVPEFVGPDLEVYGPYKKDESVVVEENIAKLLIQTNQAKNENP
ncbi:DNA replication complex GINS family protein [archaeon]|jgi:DNA replication initiation complex subunit (GINS family)|nr:DNA replication complex GINS family protein [archaeon]MBT3730877.1 DNA replication complex GINS family protein [archaeon]MBT4669884.1 DNA replication complex GINS family protein [archaeon]MBT5030036.1 DNA replication complex GINS family protein [archaeon]MBT5288137.1 DNA replication complex GINS family protein [archaeon]